MGFLSFELSCVKLAVIGELKECQKWGSRTITQLDSK
jgi:hypothetical protein